MNTNSFLTSDQVRLNYLEAGDGAPRINIPTLVIGGRISLVPWRSVEWIANQIPNARLEIFEVDEGGQHFMFLENPQKLNRLVAEFIG